MLTWLILSHNFMEAMRALSSMWWEEEEFTWVAVMDMTCHSRLGRQLPMPWTFMQQTRAILQGYSWAYASDSRYHDVRCRWCYPYIASPSVSRGSHRPEPIPTIEEGSMESIQDFLRDFIKVLHNKHLYQKLRTTSIKFLKGEEVINAPPLKDTLKRCGER